MGRAKDIAKAIADKATSENSAKLMLHFRDQKEDVCVQVTHDLFSRTIASTSFLADSYRRVARPMGTPVKSDADLALFVIQLFQIK